MKRRVVVTGIGVVSPIGIGKEAFWEAARAGRSGVDRLTRVDLPDVPCQVAAEVRGFDPKLYMDPKHIQRMDLFDQYAVAATKLALADGNLAVTPANRTRVGIVIGSALYGMRYVEEQHALFRAGGVRKISAFVPIAVFTGGPIGFASIEFGITGWSNLVSTCAASGTDAIGYARDAIAEGEADAVLAGGTEAPLSVSLLRGLTAAGALSSESNGRSREASRPYDRGRDGFVLGEGCALLLLEGEDHARSRGARVYAEILGYGSATGPYDLDGLGIDGDTAGRAIAEALDDGACRAGDVDLVNANAASERENDRVEASLLRRRYNGSCPPVTSIRSMLGQTLGASGAFQAAAGALSLAEGFIPPTINYTDPDPGCPVESLVREGRSRRLDRVLQHSFGYLGTQSALVLGACA